MLRKIILSVLFITPILTTAQISLDLDMTINRSGIQNHKTRTVVINENTPISAILDDYLTCDFIAQIDNEKVIFEGQFFETTKDNELTPATNVLKTAIPFNKTGTITLSNSENNYELILTITPILL